MSVVTHLLERPKGVRKSGPGRWVAACPGHVDRGPSLSIRGLPDGRALIHCFAGCDANDVVSAAGLELKDLFPERPAKYWLAPTRQAVDARDALACLAFEGQVLAVAAENFLEHRKFTVADVERIALAAGRINSAWRLSHGHR